MTATPSSSPRFAAIIPAAGLSQRMGQFKPLLPLAGRPVIARVVDMLAALPDIDPILLVTGHNAPALRAALAAAPITFIHNPDYATTDMRTSIQLALPHLPPDIAGIVLALGDHPAVAPATLRQLIDAFLAHDPAIAIPLHNGHRGHPVLFARRCIDEIRHLPPGETLKSLRARHARETLELPVSDPAILLDLDTPEDYARAAALPWKP